MKKVVLAVMALTLVNFGIIDFGLSDKEREMGVAELAKTQKRLKRTVKGLSDAQLNFKPTNESWSVAECVEHLAISEEMIGGMLQGALKTPADPAKRDSVKIGDQDLMAMISNRDQKVKTSEAFEPTGKYGSYKETVDAFRSKRKAHIKYLKTTKDDLRNHYGQLPFGTIDGLQILLFMSGHTERHVRQMEEVMAHADFPKG